jgi:hypothetical protein
VTDKASVSPRAAQHPPDLELEIGAGGPANFGLRLRARSGNAMLAAVLMVAIMGLTAIGVFVMRATSAASQPGATGAPPLEATTPATSTRR